MLRTTAPTTLIRCSWPLHRRRIDIFAPSPEIQLCRIEIKLVVDLDVDIATVICRYLCIAKITEGRGSAFCDGTRRYGIIACRDLAPEETV